MRPVQPLSLPVALNYKPEDKFVIARTGTSKVLLGQAFDYGFDAVQELNTKLLAISADTLRTTNTTTVNLLFTQSTRTLSATMAKEIDLSALFPTAPLFFTDDVTVTNEMHNKVVMLSSEWNEPIVIHLLEEINEGVEITFLRAGAGNVVFNCTNEEGIRTSWDSTFNIIAFRNSFVFAKKINKQQWCLRGNYKSQLGSLTEGKLALDLPPPPTGIYAEETPIPTPTPTPTPMPLPEVTPTPIKLCGCVCDCQCHLSPILHNCETNIFNDCNSFFIPNTHHHHHHHHHHHNNC